jgi:hypothetical protein
MGNRSKRRKKRQEAMKQKESHPVLTPGERQERELLLNCQEQRLTLPHQLRQWNRYFLNHASYVAALQGWVTAQSMRKGHIRIEDDVDRGLMRTQPYVPNTNHGAPKTNDNPWVGWSRDESDWDEALGATPASSTPAVPPEMLQDVAMPATFTSSQRVIA